LTQRQVAKALGIPQSQVSRAESGERRVDVIELKQFAALYGKRISSFIP
jgi:transcriptional regulator with XRE-family HTH domain